MGAPDLITALPDDMLVEILVRLRCSRAAARTGGLSRSWRGLWTRLPTHVFRGVALGSVQAALASIKAEGGPGASVTLLDISVPEASLSESELRERVPKLLDAAAELSPVEFRLAVWENTPFKYVKVVVPRFPRATSVVGGAARAGSRLRRPAMQLAGVPGAGEALPHELPRRPHQPAAPLSAAARVEAQG